MLQDVKSFSVNQLNRNYKYKRLSKSDIEDDETEDPENVELVCRTVKKSDSTVNLEYDSLFERPIQAGESLASISLKYRVPVPELKRANRLHKETEFYALNSLKIPVKHNTFLHAMLLEEQLNASPIASSSTNPTTASTNGVEGDMPVGVMSIGQMCRDKSSREEARHFLRDMEQDLDRLRKEAPPSQKASLQEAAAALKDVAFAPMPQTARASVFSCSDLDLSWRRLLAIAVTIAIGAPATYLLFTMSF